jgi:hypothetical protein
MPAVVAIVTKFYLETSAVNYFLNLLTGADCQATREYQLSKGRDWLISTTVLWELMQIRDFKDYDACMFLATFLFNPKLIKSASEIVLDFLEQGCPAYHVLKTPFTNSSIGIAWERACADRSYSFNILGSPFLDLTAKYKTISRHLSQLCNPKAQLDASVPDYVRYLRDILESSYSAVFADVVVNQVAYLRRIAILVLFVQVCCCIDLAQDAILGYWKQKDIADPTRRLQFLLGKYPDIVRRGPLWNIANAVLIQSWKHKKTSRGAIHDGLHAVYLPFVDVFITKDEHFRLLRNRANKLFFGSLHKKVHHLDEMALTFADWRVNQPNFHNPSPTGAP